ncbi:MAG TPA: hypothetical protein VHE61_20075, partial [Opitutaceae bacterium]|nr:hypothetical protein [Opitutaceae bacterium]
MTWKCAWAWWSRRGQIPAALASRSRGAEFRGSADKRATPRRLHGPPMWIAAGVAVAGYAVAQVADPAGVLRAVDP